MPRHISFTALIAIVSIAAIFRNGAWTTDLDTWSDALKKSPLKARPHTGAGKALMDDGFYDEALPLLKKAVMLLPSDSFAHNNLAAIFYRKGLYDEALKEALLSAAAWPKNAEAHVNIALVYLEKGLLDGAIAELLISLNIKPSPQTMANLAAAYEKKGMTDEAIGALESALKIEPDNSDAKYNIVAAYTNKGFKLLERCRDHDSCKMAFELFKKALSYDPLDSYAVYGAALSLEGMGRRAEAKAWWRRFLETASPGDPAREEAGQRLKTF